MPDEPVDVLIIEDEKLVLRELEEIVKYLGHRVVGAVKSGKDGIAAAKRLKPGLIVSGVKLGNRDYGTDAVKKIREEREVPVVFVTAAPEMVSRSGIVEQVWVIEKPFEVRAVETAILEAVAGKGNEVAKAD